MKFNGWSVLSILLLLAGIGFWASMASIGSGGDVGVYAVGIILIAFGVAGLLASLASRPAPAA